MTNIGIVIVHYGDPMITHKCVMSIPDNIDQFVIDNNGNYTVIANEIVIRPGSNLYYWGAIKYGLMYLDYEYLFFTNNDIIYNSELLLLFQSVLRKGTFDAVGVLIKENDNTVSGKILGLRDSKIRFLFWRLAYLNYHLARFLLLLKNFYWRSDSVNHVNTPSFAEVSALHGHAFILKRNLWQRVFGNSPLWGEELFIELFAISNGLTLSLYQSTVGTHAHSVNTGLMNSYERYKFKRKAFLEAMDIWKRL